MSRSSTPRSPSCRRAWRTPRLEADSEKWFAATAYYTALLGLSRSNPELQVAMRPLVDFFATGRRRTAKPITAPK